MIVINCSHGGTLESNPVEPHHPFPHHLHTLPCAPRFPQMRCSESQAMAKGDANYHCIWCQEEATYGI